MYIDKKTLDLTKKKKQMQGSDNSLGKLNQNLLSGLTSTNKVKDQHLLKTDEEVRITAFLLTQQVCLNLNSHCLKFKSYHQ